MAILAAIAAAGLLSDVPPVLSWMKGINPILEYTSPTLKIIPLILFFVIFPGWFYTVGYGRHILVEWYQCVYDSINYLQDILLGQQGPSRLEFNLRLSPAVKRWAVRLTVTQECRITELTEVRPEYEPRISENMTGAWLHGGTLETRIRVVFHIEATRQHASANPILSLEKLTNKKLQELLDRGSPLDEAKFEHLWKDTGVIIGSG